MQSQTAAIFVAEGSATTLHPKILLAHACNLAQDRGPRQTRLHHEDGLDRVEELADKGQVLKGTKPNIIPTPETKEPHRIPNIHPRKT